MNAYQQSNGHSASMDEQLELATSDNGLEGLLRNSAWLKGRQFKMPVWLNAVPQRQGMPHALTVNRRRELRNGSLPKGDNEDRFIRNRAVIKQIAAELKLPYPLPAEHYAMPTNPLRAEATVFHPQKKSSSKISGRDPRLALPTPTSKAEQNPTQAVQHTAQRAKRDEDEATWLRKTVLAPFYDRISKDSQEIVRLQREKSELEAELERQKRELEAAQQTARPESVIQELQVINQELEVIEKRGTKRKASMPSHMRLTTDDGNEHTMEGHLAHLADEICNDLGKVVPNETIHLCGLAPLKVMEDRPDDVLDLAQSKLHTWPYQQVPTCWRRLYEDASLGKAVQILRLRSGVLEESAPKRRRVADANCEQQTASDDWLSDVIRTLDMGISMSGAPGRGSTFEAVFQQLGNHIEGTNVQDMPLQWNIKAPFMLQTDHPIARAHDALTFDIFQQHLDTMTTPIIIPNAVAHWPASKYWASPSYFLRQTLDGARLIPVEVGESYTASNWQQKIVSFNDFLRTYILPAAPKEIGYLAQHDLFAQIPALRADICIPDYCYTAPPQPDAAVADTAGLKTVAQLSEPLLNIWFGPMGTRSPLHTDPYHNILCQVVGYKYIRLYPPTETSKLYPRGVDDKGVNMHNTSQVDVSKHVRTRSLIGNGRGYTDHDALRETRLKYPEFEGAKYVEGVLGPGECIYVPCGWWHYVEGLTTGISVSFWWN